MTTCCNTNYLVMFRKLWYKRSEFVNITVHTTVQHHNRFSLAIDFIINFGTPYIEIMSRSRIIAIRYILRESCVDKEQSEHWQKYFFHTLCVNPKSKIRNPKSTLFASQRFYRVGHGRLYRLGT